MEWETNTGEKKEGDECMKWMKVQKNGGEDIYQIVVLDFSARKH
jgi:hypothetical protein